MKEKLACPKCSTEHLPEFDLKPNDKRVFKGKCKKCGHLIKFKLNDDSNQAFLERDSISFNINGTQYTVNNEYPFSMSLNVYLRDVLKMTGTKVMCREGGCGSCIVNISFPNIQTKQEESISINSCLFPLYSCDGLSITTIEGVGSKQKGFNEIQKRLANKNGSQCGWCSPGMVMNMYSLLSKNPKPTKSLIENTFDGNICRCTGYRPILDAMKSFAIDEKPIDIEELNKLKCLNDHNKNGNECQTRKKKVHIIKDGMEWYTPKTMDDLFDLINQYETLSYKIVSGNTGVGVFKNEGPYSIFIDIKNIEELYQVKKTDNSLCVGAEISLNKLIEIFNDYSSKSGFYYLQEISKHLSKIANVSVRNCGSWSGNLVMKINHPDFASDVFTCFETINAMLTLVGPTKTLTPIQCTPSQLLQNKQYLKNRVIYSVNLIPFDSIKTIVKTFKIMPRSNNAHAYVNAGFRFEIDPITFIVQSMPTIVFGGISENFSHANKTESYFYGKSINARAIIQNSFEILNSELIPSSDPVLSSPEYRRSLSLSLLYKFLLFVNEKNINPRYLSAIDSIIDSREVSNGFQSFPSEDPSLYPVTKPMTKLNAVLQTSGEAKYVYDMELGKNGLNGAFIISTIGNCRIDKIDTTDATKLSGVKKFIFAKDIPGKNTFMTPPSLPELLFAEDYIDYAGQAIGLVVAETFEQAYNASKAVKITYKEMKPQILNIEDAIKQNSFFPNPPSDFVYGNAEQAIANSPHVIEGDLNLGTQFHFYMENQVSVCEPTEDGFELYSSSQWLDSVQNAVAQVLGISNSSSINVKVKQLGGAYGGKITRSNMVASAAALASQLLDKQVRVALDLNTCMELIGKRFPWYVKYKIGVNNDGKFLGIILDVYNDCGNNPNDNSLSAVIAFADNSYSCKNWHIKFHLAKTNLPANTACRSPGTFPSITIMESMIEHVIKYFKADPIQLRKINLYNKGDITPAGQHLTYFNVDQIINDLISNSDYINRSKNVKLYNQNNRWKKKGLGISPIKWGAGWNGAYYNAIVSIMQSDGSISLFHSGVEVGQGIHTKVVQVCAYELGVPIEIISVKYANNMTNPNAQSTGGSITSEIVSSAVIECCKILNKNLEPIRKLMPDKYTWRDLIAKAFSMGVDLTAHYWEYPNTPDPFAYNVYGAAISETIIDVLTGEFQIIRADILYDGGQSLNGEIDIGQAEGAFVMGIGFWLFEKARYDPISGRCLTNGTWEYKPPTARDIPVDFRITFMKNNPNPLGVLGSKCVGEPPLCLSSCVAFAIKNSIENARAEINNQDFFPFNSPSTVESIQQMCLVDVDQFDF